MARFSFSLFSFARKWASLSALAHTSPVYIKSFRGRPAHVQKILRHHNQQPLKTESLSEAPLALQDPPLLWPQCVWSKPLALQDPPLLWPQCVWSKPLALQDPPLLWPQCVWSKPLALQDPPSSEPLAVASVCLV
jgi:hypothetical protein